jgi:hypothetical protein
MKAFDGSECSDHGLLEEILYFCSSAQLGVGAGQDLGEQSIARSCEKGLENLAVPPLGLVDQVEDLF